MGLGRALCLLLVAAGCGQSLFDARGRRDGGGPGGDDDGGGGDDGSVPVTCPAASCIADAAADYNNAQGGANGHWRYLEDKRNRTWVTMTPDATGMVGAEVGNRIEPCAGSSAAGCRALPGALLVSSSALSADPAIEYRSFEAKVIQLALRVHLDQGGQRVRLYRNSREDVLFTAIAAQGETVTTTITLDALPLDRFLVALEPTDGTAGLAALHFFIIDAGQTFPQTCELAIPFTSLGFSTNSVRDLCGNTDVASRQGDATSPVGLRYDAFGKTNAAGYFEPGFNYRGAKVLNKPGDRTVQFWVIQDTPIPMVSAAWLYSDIDQASGGGLGIRLRYGTPNRLEAAIYSTQNPPGNVFQGVDYGNADVWYFVRVIHASGTVTICLDGKKVMSLPLAGPLVTGQVPSLGRNGIWETSSDLLGGLDEVRVFSTALPCNDN
jgi:concanavalin A-like lectin/glucanase superfamily protein